MCRHARPGLIMWGCEACMGEGEAYIPLRRFDDGGSLPPGEILSDTSGVTNHVASAAEDGDLMETREAELVLEVQAAQLRRQEAYERDDLSFFQRWDVDEDVARAMDRLRRHLESEG